MLTSGTRLGPYEIVAPIGAGGMGEVYRAHDARLRRDVAVKVLPRRLARDTDRLHRFEQEARAAAALSHPNIVAVFDFGVADEGPFVVSELLEGETLRALVARGALPPRRAVDLAVQTATGMAAAHQRGIVHRDLKPENIFVTADGRAKILDFGLAKLTEPIDAPPVGDAATALVTMPGLVLGTAGYMSPEQVRGEPADLRTDIFAFGAVFYEMLSGRRAFAGDTVVETMGAILKAEPPEFVAGAVPLALDRIVRRCLAKQPSQRFQSASDIAFALEAVSAPLTASTAPVLVTASVEPAPGVARRRIPLRLASAAIALLAAGAALGALAIRWFPTPAPAPTFRALTFDRLPVTNARFMPDGETVVYSAAPHAYVPELFVIRPNVEGPQALGVPAAHLLSVSSRGELALIVDARHVAQRLYAGTLARMTIGSTPRAMRDDVREADWSPDGATLAVVHDLGDGRDRLEFPSGTVLHEASGYLSDPRVSPDGQRVAFFEHQWRFDDRGWLKVVDRSGKVTTLSDELSGLQGLSWTPDGSSLVFSGSASGGSPLQPMIVPVSGRAAPRLVMGTPGRFVVHDLARDGRWLAVREDLSFGVRARVPGHEGERELSWLGSAGGRALSHDGRWLLMVDVGPAGGAEYGVVLRSTDGRQTMRLGQGSAQRISPDGKWAAAMLAAPSRVVVYPTGTGDGIHLGAATIASYSSAEWFPDSQRLLVCGAEPARAPRCYEQDLAGSPPTPLTEEGVLASVAPDGRTVLLTREDGSMHLSMLGGGPSIPVTALRADDKRIAWSADSRAVLVQSGRDVPATVERVDLATGQRTLVGRVAPDGPGAIAMIDVVDWAEHGGWYVYNYTRLPSTLFLVAGAPR